MRIVWLSQYPVDIIPDDYVVYDKSKVFHPSTWVVNLADGLAKSDEIELHIITESSWVKKDYRFKYNNINFHILRSPYSIPFTTKNIRGLYHFDILTKYYFSYLKFKKEIYSINPDLIHSQGTEGLYSYVASKTSYPYLITLNGIISILGNMYEGKIWKPISLMEKETIVKSNFFISHADFCDEFIRNLNKNAKIFKIDDITKDEYFNIKREPVKNSILFIAYPTKTKGLKELILTFNEIYFQYDDIKIIVVGNYDENYKKSLLSLLKSHEAKDKIIFKGFLSNQNLLIEFSKADLFVFPSYFETSPNVIMEAMSAGVPIITTNVGGIPDMISDGYTGLLVEPKNSVDLKSKITFLLDNPELKVFLGNNARIEAKKRFKNKIVVEKVLSAYKYVIDNSNKIK